MITRISAGQLKFPKVPWSLNLEDLRAGVVVAIPLAAVALATGLDFKLVLDERFFHSKVIEAFAGTWPRIDISDYPSSSAPLSYALRVAFGQIAGFEIARMRVLSVVATYLATYLFYVLCKRSKLPYPVLSALVFLIFPYIFFYGFTLFPVSMALAFGIGALFYYLLDDPSTHQLLLGSVLATLAIYSRQSFLALPMGILLFEIWQAADHGIAELPSRLFTRERLRRISILSIPVILFVPLAIIWGGVSPPTSQEIIDGIGPLVPRPEHFNYILIFVGFYFAFTILRPQTLEILRRVPRILILVGALLPLFLLFPLEFHDTPTSSTVAGLILRAIEIVRYSIGDMAAGIGMFGLWIAGLLVLVTVWIERPWSLEVRKLLSMAAIVVALVAFSPFVVERFYLLLVPLLILVIHRAWRSRYLLMAWIAVQAVITAGYSYYQVAVK